MHQTAYTHTERMTYSHASTAIIMCLSQHKHRYQTHDLKPYSCASASVYLKPSTGKLLCVRQRIHRHQTHGLHPFIYCHTLVHQTAKKDRHQMHAFVHRSVTRQIPKHGFKSCIYCNTLVHQRATRQTPNAWP